MWVVLTSALFFSLKEEIIPIKTRGKRSGGGEKLAESLEGNESSGWECPGPEDLCQPFPRPLAGVR